ncbi:hypothetical protein ACIRO1_18105 [Streptomyces sp. NPDC102381]
MSNGWYTLTVMASFSSAMYSWALGGCASGFRYSCAATIFPPAPHS